MRPDASTSLLTSALVKPVSVVASTKMTLPSTTASASISASHDFLFLGY